MATRDPGRAPAATLESRIRARDATIGIIGLGYVGLPLAVEFARVGFHVIGFDADRTRVDGVTSGHSYIADVPTAALGALVRDGRLRASTDFAPLAATDVAVICVQTPFTATKEPDLSFVVSAVQAVWRHLHTGQLIVLQSTTYPGTTEEVVLPILAASGKTVGTDFFLAFSPERVDPGNPTHTTRDIPKVVGGVTPACAHLARLLFEQIVASVHTVSSARVAEMTKLLENVFRSVNIALVNELAHLCERMGVSVWEIIDAAATKPFGFMPFYPGPGVGGHCIPVDPYYLAWKAREYDFNTRFIALAAEINENMPYYIADRVTEAVNIRLKKSISQSRILALGVTYKRGVADTRESPALKVLGRLRRRGASIAYHDPFVGAIQLDGEDYASIPLTADAVRSADCVVVLADHPGIDYAWLAAHATLVFDTRNVTGNPPALPANVIRL